MLNIKELYRKNIYGVMGTLIFHILLVSAFLFSELRLDEKAKKEEAILLDFTIQPEKEKVPEAAKPLANAGTKNSGNSNEKISNRAVNDAPTNIRKTDKFFDDSYRKDIEEAKKVVSEVSNQLSKKIQPIRKFEMPEATTEGQNPDAIKNLIYSGKSNIHYFLENRYHIRLPIPVYLAHGGGEISVDIQVDRSGKVIKAEVRPPENINDAMLPVYALQAAEHTIFNPEPKAPAVQKGTITYKFVAQ